MAEEKKRPADEDLKKTLSETQRLKPEQTPSSVPSVEEKGKVLEEASQGKPEEGSDETIGIP